MMEVLFARLPEDLQLRAIKQTARFVTTSTLASVTNEASLICNAAAWAAPKASTELLLKPLLNRIEEEVRHDDTSDASRMSKVLCLPVHLHTCVTRCCAHKSGFAHWQCQQESCTLQWFWSPSCCSTPGCMRTALHNDI